MKTWNVQLAHNINDHPIAPGEWFTLTQKLNGIRGTFYRGEMIGRNGTHYAGLEHIEKALAPYTGLVFDGEITLADPDPLTDSEAFRAAAGLVRRKSGDKSNLALTIFDVIPVSEFENGTGRTTYRARREQLDKFASRFSGLPNVRILPALYCGRDTSVIPQFLREMTADGKEGLIANLDTAYQCRRSSGILKIKQFHTMDLPVIRCEPGTGELSNTLGSLIVGFNGNEVGVGVGFTMEQRDDFWRIRDTLRGKLVEVKYKEVSSNAHGGQSLQFPVFLSLRTDKQEVSYGPAAPLDIFDIITAAAGASPAARHPGGRSWVMTTKPKKQNAGGNTMQYYEISEETARRSHEMMSMTDYREGSATAGYRSAVDEAAALVEAQKAKVSPFYHGKLDALLDRYARRLAQWTNDHNRNGASCPSVLVCGPANFPTRKKVKQNAREDTLWKEYDEIKKILDKIKSVGTGPIDLTDPYAREMLEDRLQSLQKTLETGKAMNAHYRKHKTMKGFRDYDHETAAEMDQAIARAPDFAQTPFPDFELASLRGKIKRVQENLAKLDKMDAAQGQPDKEELFDGGRVVHNVTDNRLQIQFDEIPDEEIRSKLKSYGFRWSRRNQVWQRQLTRNAIYDARRILNITPPAQPATTAEDAAQQDAPQATQEEAPAPAPKEQPAPTTQEIAATEDAAGIDGFPQYSLPNI